MGVLFGPGPVFCCFWLLLFALFFRWRNASLARGFAGRRVLCLWLCGVLIDLPAPMDIVSLQMFITVFVPAWMIPPVYHSLRRESIKTASSASPIGVQSVRSTWFEDTTPKDTAPQPNQDPQKQQPQPLHGLKLVIKEEVLPTNDQPEFPSLKLLAARGLLASDTW